MREWTSVHLYVDHAIYTPSYDWVINETASSIQTVLRERRLIDEAFFVRYVDTGPHLRLRVRLLDKSSWSQVKGIVEETASRWDKAPKQIVTVAWIGYVPEVERYGGSNALPAAESFFSKSSAAVSTLLGQIESQPRSARLGRALLLTMLLPSVAACSPEETSRWLRSYVWYVHQAVDADARMQYLKAARQLYDVQREGLADRFDGFWTSLTTGQTFGDGVDEYLHACREYVTRLRSMDARTAALTTEAFLREFWSPIGAQVHMTNNRLGVSKTEEAQLAAIASFLLEETSRTQPHV